MNFVKRILNFIKSIFKKEENIKMLIEPSNADNKSNFVNSLKVKITQKPKVETLTCFGDGLGIQNKISY